MSGAFVIDTSALIAPLLSEPGGEAVFAAVAEADAVLLSTVNLAEAIGILGRRRGLSAAAARTLLSPLQFEIVAFNAEQAVEAGGMEARWRGKGISLGDRACLALAQTRALPVLTADRAWATLGLDLEIRVIR